jgi:hypothetical protein
VDFSNIQLQYFQQQMARVISYFNNRFMWALSYADPYADYSQLSKQQPMTEGEIDSITDLNQPDFGIDLHINFLKSSVLVKERPYLNQKQLELQIDLMHITQRGEEVYGRHLKQPKLKMKLSTTALELKKVKLFFIDEGKNYN